LTLYRSFTENEDNLLMSRRKQTESRLRYLGFGLRLRREYLFSLLRDRPAVDWFEVISECYLEADESSLKQLDELRRYYPIVMHGTSLAVGSPWQLDHVYLQKLRRLIERIEPEWISDHLCWSGADDTQGQLLPLPYTRDALDHVIQRVRQVQDLLGRRILLENVPGEPADPPSEIPEAEFLTEVAEASDSLILIDISNLHASSVNQGFDPRVYLEQIPEDRVQQIHLAGAITLCHPQQDPAQESADPIWELYTAALERFGPVSTMIERVDTIPSLSEMVKEVDLARCAAQRFLSTD
jgi:uncharacterized protein (UPF0276 family)